MKSQSWTTESVPANRPTPIERAGLTEVPVAPIEAKWINVSARPMASGAIGGGVEALEAMHQDPQREAGEDTADGRADRDGGVEVPPADASDGVRRDTTVRPNVSPVAT